MSKLNIGIDVDLTLVDSGTAWLEWLDIVYGVSFGPSIKSIPKGETVYYNLSKYFPQPSSSQVTPFDFWEDPFLYDKLKPLPGSVEAIKKLKEAGHNIRFVSHCKKGHFSSKVRFLKRHFPFVDLESATGDGFYATKAKNGVAVDVLVDDRHSFLNQMDDNVIKILFETPYDQEVELKTTPDYRGNDWEHIGGFILENF